MARSQELIVELVAKVDGAARDIQGVSRQTAGLGQVVGRVGGLIAGTFAVGQVIDFGKEAVQAASDLEQSIGGVESVFKGAADTVLGFGANAAESVGLASSQYNTLSTQLGGLIKSSGLTSDMSELAGITDELITVGADLAATYGGTTQEAVDAIGAAFRGEADSAERFNLQLNAGRVAAKAVELGLADTTSAVDDQARATALMTLIQEQSTDALGQFGREADTVAGQQARLTAKWEDAQAQIGQALVPVVLALFDALEPLIPTFVDIVESMAPMIEVIATELIPPLADLIDELLPLLVVALEATATSVRLFIVPVIEALSTALETVVGWIQSFRDWLSRVQVPSWLSDVGSTIGGWFGGREARPSEFSPVGSAFRAVGPAGGTVAPVINITINAGVGDPVQIGRQVVDALDAYERANGTRYARVG